MKACVNIISSRKQCIAKCISSLWDSWNHRYNYPVYVYYFDDIYDSEDFRNMVRKESKSDVKFISIPYKTPEHISEDKLFYNRTDLWYVNTGRFTKRRKGYLHMCNFRSNMHGYPETEFHEYDYIMTHDDESGYPKKYPHDPFEVMKSRPESLGAFITGQRLKNGAPHQGHLDTRIGFWDFTKNFLLKNNITPKNKKIQELLNDPNAEVNYHFLDWCDTYVIKNDMFRSDLWKKWITAVNESGGIYKCRWGDNEIISMFGHIYQENIYNLKLVEDGYYDQGQFRNLQSKAPNVKNLEI